MKHPLYYRFKSIKQRCTKHNIPLCFKDIDVWYTHIKDLPYFNEGECIIYMIDISQGYKAGNLKCTPKGISSYKLYYTWLSMKRRCDVTTDKNYINYGAKGITVSKEFYDFFIWLHYVEALDGCYGVGLSLDRINVNKGYYQGNLRWATSTVQNVNTKLLRKSNKSGYRGVSYSNDNNKWRAIITIARQNIHLGYFKEKIDAAKAYDNYILENKLEHTINGVE